MSQRYDFVNVTLIRLTWTRRRADYQSLAYVRSWSLKDVVTADSICDVKLNVADFIVTHGVGVRILAVLMTSPIPDV